MQKKKLLFHAFLALTLVFALTPTVALADTNGTEIQVADTPDKLVLQLGAEWAGVEFELKTDAGVFPAPVVVDTHGILRMDLGGSKTYTLSCLKVAATVPVPSPSAEVSPSGPVAAATESVNPAETPGSEDAEGGIPTTHLILFIGGLVIAVGGLIAIRLVRQRKEAYYEDEYEDD
jgi:hypothetical protein